MGLFGNKADRQAKRDAAEARSNRLAGLSPTQLAAEVMPAFGAHGINAKSGRQQGPMEVVSWLMPDAPVKFRQPILGPVIEALGMLEHANLLRRSSFGSNGTGSTYRATREGETALTDDTVAQQLGA